MTGQAGDDAVGRLGATTQCVTTPPPPLAPPVVLGYWSGGCDLKAPDWVSEPRKFLHPQDALAAELAALPPDPDVGRLLAERAAEIGRPSVKCPACDCWYDTDATRRYGKPTGRPRPSQCWACGDMSTWHPPKHMRATDAAGEV